MYALALSCIFFAVSHALAEPIPGESDPYSLHLHVSDPNSNTQSFTIV
jgi:hypothetical protein